MRHHGQFPGGFHESPSLLLTENNGKPHSLARGELGSQLPVTVEGSCVTINVAIDRMPGWLTWLSVGLWLRHDLMAPEF